MPVSPLSVSSILLSWNCEAFIEGALEGVLAQDCPPMDILVSDDASTDSTYAVLQAEIARYRGPHRVTLRRRATNSGSKSAHLDEVVGSTTGEIVVSFDGDDIYDPTRVRKLVSEFARDPSVYAVYSSYVQIDEAGRVSGRGKVPHPPAGVDPSTWFARIDAYASGSTLAVRRPVFERFGPLDPQIHEDIVLPFRASLLGAVRFLDEPLVRARRRAGSMTADYARFTSVQAYRQRMHWGIEKARRHLGARRIDLQRAAEFAPERREHFEALDQIAAASLANAELTADLVSPSLGMRLGALARVLRSGAYRDEFAQNFCLALIPDLYLAYKRRKLGISPTQAKA